MTQAELMLVDLREQVKGALESMECALPFTVRQKWPREGFEGVVITYAQKDNRSTACSVVDALQYQVDVWAKERGEAIQAARCVNCAMLELGLKRESMRESVEENALRRCSMVFGRKVDKRWMRLMD